MHHMNITLIQLAKPTFCSHRSLLDIVRSLSTNLYYFHLPDHREIFIISTYISSDFSPYLLVLLHRGIRLPRCGYFLIVNFTAVLYLTFVWCFPSFASVVARTVLRGQFAFALTAQYHEKESMYSALSARKFARRISNVPSDYETKFVLILILEGDSGNLIVYRLRTQQVTGTGNTGLCSTLQR